MPPVVTEELNDLRFLGGIYQGIENQFRQIDYEPILRMFGEKLAAEHQEYFERGAGPSGSSWPALAPSTIARKGHDAILVDKGRLSRSLIEVAGGSDAIREYTHRGLIFGTSVPYSVYHQEGRGQKVRDHVGLSEEILDALLGDVADATVEGLKATANSRI